MYANVYVDSFHISLKMLLYNSEPKLKTLRLSILLIPIKEFNLTQNVVQIPSNNKLNVISSRLTRSRLTLQQADRFA